MVLPSLPQTLIPAISFLAWFTVNWLKHSTLPEGANAFIALLVPVFVAVIWGIAINVFTAQNLWGDIAAIILLSYAALALPELATWRQWLQDTFKSPFAGWPASTTVDVDPAITTSPGPATPYQSPQALALPTTPAVPPSRRPQFVDPSPSLHSRPLVQITVPSQPTATPPEADPSEETPEPGEEPPAQS